MSRPPTSSESNLQAFFERARQLPKQPEAVRARALARARAAAAAPLPGVTVDAPRSRWLRQLVAPAAAAALASGIVGSVFALGGYWSRGETARTTPAVAVASHAVPPPAAAPLIPSPSALPSTAAEAAPEPDATSHVRLNRGSPNARTRDSESPSYAAELELMRSAHVAYARHDFTNALVLAGEHARRFPGGLLTEEREALRVRSLVGAGRLAEARRVAAAFATRFPRSVLVHRLQTEVGAGG